VAGFACHSRNSAMAPRVNGAAENVPNDDDNEDNDDGE
jgi:hypothetical protein